MKAYDIKSVIFLFLVLVVSGCKKLVEVDAPSNQLVTASVFAGDNTAISAQLSIYQQMQIWPWQLATITALSSDELANSSSNTTAQDLYANNLNVNDAGLLVWGSAYNYIYQENAIIENTRASGGITPNTKNLLLGEAEFVRAFWYFYLVNLYGDVPLITTTNYKTNTAMARTPQAQVYTQMVVDLNDALNKLSPTFLDATDTVVTVDRVRPTNWAASALLARTYLYMGKYDSAVAAASTVINNTSLFGLPALNSVFLKNSSEAIWQIMPPPTQTFTNDGNYFILYQSPGAQSSSLGNCCSLDSQLLKVFEPGDQRLVKWVGSYKSGATTWNFPYKYKNNAKGSVNSGEYSMVLRLAEQYLIRAEARAQLNDLPDAISDINVIRARAGLAPLSNGLNQSQVLSAVLHERQVELFTEAHRWLDLKRTKTVDAIMTIVTPQKTAGTWNSYQQLYPLLLTDIQSAGNLSQTPGY
jgi:hypothetical protein